MTYISHTQHLKQNLQSAQVLNQQLHVEAEKPVELNDNPPLQFTDEADLLPPITLQDFLLIEAEKNYLHLWIMQNGVPTDYRLRSTLKEQEVRLRGHEQPLSLSLCLLVNLDQVMAVSGNSAGYRLTIRPELPRFQLLGAKFPILRLR